MVRVVSIPLNAEQLTFDRLQFVRAEWWKESPRIALLRYRVEGRESAEGLRLDLDKRAILDDVADHELDSLVKNDSGRIWDAVVEASAELLAYETA